MAAKTAPDFTLAGTSGIEFTLSASRGEKIVLYFYPKDNTPGCTTEAQQFRDLHEEFRALGCRVLGISRDSVKSHENFKAKLRLPFDLLSDPEEKVCREYDVIKTKMMYGKKVQGVERSTFAIDGKGKLRREWRRVKVPDHAREVLEFVRTL